MSLSHTPRSSLLISLSMLAGFGLLVFTYLHPFTWRVDLHPMWGWMLCGIGLSVTVLPMLGFLWAPLGEHWPVLIFLCVIGLVMAAAGWDLEWALLFLSHLARWLMYSAGLVLTGFGAWQIITRHSVDAKWSFAATYNQGYKAGHTKGYEEGYAKAYWNEHGRFDDGHAEGRVEGRIEGYEEGYSAGKAQVYTAKYNEGYGAGRAKGYEEGYSDGSAKAYTDGYTAGSANGFTQGYTQAVNETQDRKYDEGYAAGYAKGRADSTTRERKTRSFDPWQVLEIPPGSTQEEIRQAYRKQSQLYHPDKVSRLGKDLRDMAEEKTKDINHAYERLGGR